MQLTYIRPNEIKNQKALTSHQQVDRQGQEFSQQRHLGRITMQDLQSFTLENYKAFKNRSTFNIRPLTLFYGYNSAGKSAALRFLQLLADSTSGISASPLNLRSEVLRGSSFDSLLSKHTKSEQMKIQLDFSDHSTEYQILNIPEQHRQQILSVTVARRDQEVPFVLEWLPDEDTDEQSSSKFSYTSQNGYTEISVRFDGLVPADYPEESRESLGLLRASLSAYAKSFTGLSTDCPIPNRYEVEISPARTISRDGAGLVSLLQAASPAVIESISKWYINATGHSFSRQEIAIGSERGHRFTLHPNENPSIDIDIVDTGEGMGKVLPVIGLLKLIDAGALSQSPIISLEHPELHIHPDAHIHLADLFCEATSSNKNSRILVETHSESLLLGVQIAISEGRISPDDVAIHWVRSTEDGAKVELVELDEEARPRVDNWPPDVFRETSKLAKTLYERRRNKQR